MVLKKEQIFPMDILSKFRFGRPAFAVAILCISLGFGQMEFNPFFQVAPQKVLIKRFFAFGKKIPDVFLLEQPEAKVLYEGKDFKIVEISKFSKVTGKEMAYAGSSYYMVGERAVMKLENGFKGGLNAENLRPVILPDYARGVTNRLNWQDGEGLAHRFSQYFLENGYISKTGIKYPYSVLCVCDQYEKNGVSFSDLSYYQEGTGWVGNELIDEKGTERSAFGIDTDLK